MSDKDKKDMFSGMLSNLNPALSGQPETPRHVQQERAPEREAPFTKDDVPVLFSFRCPRRLQKAIKAEALDQDKDIQDLMTEIMENYLRSVGRKV